MFKRTIAALTILAAVLCLAVKVDAADATRHTKDDSWLIYWYICGPNDLEGNAHFATRDIAEMQRVKLPPNIKVLIAAGSTQNWHHPTIAAGGHGIYLYSANRFEKQVDFNENMGNPNTLVAFLRYGEENFPADHRIIIFQNHGGVSGICYDDSFKGDGLYYDELKSAFATVYGNSPDEQPFELVSFNACVSASYELANSIADFSRYMMGSEPSENPVGWDYQVLFGALAKDSSVNGAQLGKVICDNALKHYDDPDVKNFNLKSTNAFSVIDLTKMPELREAYEAYFDEAVTRANEETGFSGAFARAANARSVDKYSNLYADLGLIAKNTKSIMPEASNKLLKAIDKAVVYNKRGEYLKGRGISTYYPYISSENPAESGANYIKLIDKQNSSYSAQKALYKELLGLDVSQLNGTVSVERKNDHLVAALTPEQLENVSSIKCMLFPLDKSDDSRFGSVAFGGAVLVSSDDLKIDWKKGIVTENFRAVEPVIDGHKIAMMPLVSGRGHTFYKVPILYNDAQRNLLIRYDTSSKKYSIVGFGSTIENGMVRSLGGRPQPGSIITPINIVIEDNADTKNVLMFTNPETNQNEPSMVKVTDPQTRQTWYIKLKSGAPFVFTRDSAVTGRQIINGNYMYFFGFTAPNGETAVSQPGFISVEYGKVSKFDLEDYKVIAEVAEDAE